VKKIERRFNQALVTGATSGIGEALSILLASKHIPLILTGRNEPKLCFLKRKLEKKIPVHFIIADLKNFEDRKKIHAAVQDLNADLVINNAGFGIYGDTIKTQTSEQMEILEVNAAAVLETTLETARFWVKNKKKGVILNVSSASSFHPAPGMNVYAASKGFVTLFSKALNTELENTGVRVLVSCPGQVDTSFAERAARKKMRRHEPAMSSEFAANQIWRQIQTLKDCKTFNWQYRLVSWMAIHLLPEKFVKRIIYNRVKSRL
jgi:short-subunit dehydrogenase